MLSFRVSHPLDRWLEDSDLQYRKDPRNKSCGTPVVATPVGANPEVLEPLGEEFLCRDTLPEALAERIIWFIKEGTDSRLRKLCREYCETNFRVDKVVDEIEWVLQATTKEE